MKINPAIFFVLLAVLCLGFFAPIRFTQIEKAAAPGYVPITGAGGVMAYRTMSALGDSLSAYLGCASFSQTNGDSTYLYLTNGDSVFVGTEFILNNGRVLYVSKSGYKGSGTETVGDPNRPWSNPWAAVAAASEFDLIYVYPARYFISDIGGGGDIETATSNATNINLYKKNIVLYMEKNVIIENASTTAQSLFGTFENSGTCTMLGNASILQSSTGRFDFAFDLGSTTSGSLYLECYESNCAGGGFMFRVCPRIDIVVKTNMRNTNNIGEFLRTKNVSVKAGRVLQSNAKRHQLSVDIANTGGIISLICDEYVVSDSAGSVFVYGGGGMTGDSIHVEFKTKRFTVNSSAKYVIGFSDRGKVFARNSTGSGNNKFLYFQIDEINDRSADTIPMFSINAAAPPDMMRAYVDIKKGYSTGPLYSAYIAGNDHWNFNVSDWVNASTTKPVFQNFSRSVNGSLTVTGNFTSASTPILVLSAARKTTFNNATLTCSATSCILTNHPLNVKSSYLITGAFAALSNISTTPVNISVMNSYTNSLLVDSDVNEIVSPLVKNTSVQ